MPPQAELKRICAFLDIEYDEGMCILTQATENIGAAVGEKVIVRTNCNKYLNEMPLSLRNKIEAIAGSTLASLGDEVGPCSGHCSIPQAKMLIYKALDGVNLLKSTTRRVGLVETVKYTYGALAVSKKSPHQ